MQRIQRRNGIFSGLAIAALVSLSFVGCKSDDNTVNTPPATNQDPTEFKFTSNATFKYHQAQLDTTGPSNPNGDVKQLAGTDDTMTSTLKTSTGSYAGQTGNVAVYENTYANAGHQMDSTIYYQKNGDIYRYNFGIDFLNTFPALQAFLVDGNGNPKPANVGWVLQARLQDTTSKMFLAGAGSFELNNVPLAGHINGDILDSAMYIGSSMMTVGSQSVRVKQYRHTIHVDATVATIDIVVDSYVSAALGTTVKDVVHSSGIKSALINQQVPGLITTMLESSVTVK